MGDFDENFDDAPLPPVTIAAIAELPEIKLFSRWSCDDVQVADMSLQVICLKFTGYFHVLSNPA